VRAGLAKESKNLVLVGHLPYLSRLVARLLGLPADKQVVRFQMGGVLDRDTKPAVSETIKELIPHAHRRPHLRHP